MILKRCIEIIEKEDNCDEFEEKGSCLQCVKDSFRSPNSDTYNCFKKLATYTVYYGTMYTSEIYHFLEQSKLLEKYFNNKKIINVLSLGCGVMLDKIALKYYIKNKEMNINLSYKGYDIEPLWNEINFSEDFETKNIVDGFDCREIDIIFMNKVFSTLKSNDLSNDFLDTFEKELKKLSSGSFVIFNDINRDTQGRDEFNYFALHNSLESIGQYFFNHEKEYTLFYTEIKNNKNRYNAHIKQILPDNFPFQPKDEPSRTVFFLYRKI